MQSVFILIISAVLLAGCAKPSQAPPPSMPETQPPVPARPQPGPQPTPQPDQVPNPPATAAQSVADRAQAQDLALRAVNLLDEGREGEAKAELQKALALDRNNTLADSLMHQITADPVATLGAKSFRYAVRPGDTLSKIAEAFLKDQYKFYILARYNSISVPRSLRVGQVIQVPGSAPPPQLPPPTAGFKDDHGEQPKTGPAERLYQEGQQAARDGDKDKAYDLFMQAAKLDPRDQRARAAADQLKPELIALHDRKAREAYRRQDLNTTIKEWDRVLELDPNNGTARLERRRAEELNEHLKSVQ
jgi:tetratricopeptide (TPR) repeat protein